MKGRKRHLNELDPGQCLQICMISSLHRRHTVVTRGGILPITIISFLVNVKEISFRRNLDS